MAIPPNLKRVGYPCHIYMKKKIRKEINKLRTDITKIYKEQKESKSWNLYGDNLMCFQFAEKLLKKILK